MRPISSAISLNADIVLSIADAIVSSPCYCAECATNGSGGLDLASDPAVERPRPAAPHQEMKHHDRPEQRIFNAARFPIVSEFQVVGDDRDDEKTDDRAGRDAREQAECEAKPANELQDADHPGPQHAVFEADALEEARRALDIAEQDLVAVIGE